MTDPETGFFEERLQARDSRLSHGGIAGLYANLRARRR
jgi:hypothetical protein